jgi:imidazolonepropionase-like amidohydrolase
LLKIDIYQHVDDHLMMEPQAEHMGKPAKVGFYNFQLFDGISDHLRTGTAIRVIDGIIAGIDEPDDHEHHPGYQWIDLKGRTLMPGLIDAHVHITVPFVFKVNFDAIRQMNRQLEKNFYNCVKYGVTTVRDMGAFPAKIQHWRKKINAGKAVGPRIVTANSFVTSRNGVPEMAPRLNSVEAMIAGGQFVERVETPADAARVANRLIDEGADWLKTQYSDQSFLFHGQLENLSDDCYMALRRIADQRNVRLAMHQMETAGFRKGVRIGADSLEHTPVDPLSSDDIDHFITEEMAIVPTLKVFGDVFEIEEMRQWLQERGKTDFMPEPLRQSVFNVEKLMQKPYPPDDYMKKFYMDVDFFKRGYPTAMKNIEKIKAGGGRIGVGTDVCGTGLSFFGHYYKELVHLMKAGFSAAETLKAATAVNADIIGMGDRIGTVETYKQADFTIIDGNPLEDITAAGNVRCVVKGGEIIYHEEE